MSKSPVCSHAGVTSRASNILAFNATPKKKKKISNFCNSQNCVADLWAATRVVDLKMSDFCSDERTISTYINIIDGHGIVRLYTKNKRA